jgi:hypothetical protein
MKGQYNNMYLKNILIGFLDFDNAYKVFKILIGFLDFDNAYKVFMLSSLSGSKLQTGVLYGGITPWSTVSDYKGTVKEKLINVS